MQHSHFFKKDRTKVSPYPWIRRTTQPAFWPAARLRRTSVSAAGGNLGAEQIYFARALEFQGVQAAKRPEPKKKDMTYGHVFLFGASDEARTRYLHLGKVALYQMSYTRNSRVYISRFSPRCQYFFIFSLPQSHGLWVDRDQAASPHWGTRSLRQEYPAPVSSPSVQKRRSPSWVRST